MTNFNIIIASLPDREKLVAEIWLDDKHLAEISQEEDSLLIELFEHKKLRLDLASFKVILDEAEKQLLHGTRIK